MRQRSRSIFRGFKQLELGRKTNPIRGAKERGRKLGFLLRAFTSKRRSVVSSDSRSFFLCETYSKRRNVSRYSFHRFIETSRDRARETRSTVQDRVANVYYDPLQWRVRRTCGEQMGADEPISIDHAKVLGTRLHSCQIRPKKFNTPDQGRPLASAEYRRV